MDGLNGSPFKYQSCVKNRLRPSKLRNKYVIITSKRRADVLVPNVHVTRPSTGTLLVYGYCFQVVLLCMFPDETIQKVDEIFRNFQIRINREYCACELKYIPFPHKSELFTFCCSMTWQAVLARDQTHPRLTQGYYLTPGSRDIE